MSRNAVTLGQDTLGAAGAATMDHTISADITEEKSDSKLLKAREGGRVGARLEQDRKLLRLKPLQVE